MDGKITINPSGGVISTNCIGATALLRVGREIQWGPFSETVDIWNGERFINVAELVPMTAEDKAAFKELLAGIAALTDAEIEAWDERSLEEWLAENVSQAPVRELMTDLGMIMTTIPAAIDMAAGEVLYITRENLQKTKQALAASYPREGMSGINQGLVETILANGGEIRLNEPPVEQDENKFSTGAKPRLKP